jgi:hypothetical protein
VSAEKVWIIDLPVHVIADSADLARDHLARVSDRGPVRLHLEDEPNEAVTVLYVNYPEDRGHDGQTVYDVDRTREGHWQFIPH